MKVSAKFETLRRAYHFALDTMARMGTAQCAAQEDTRLAVRDSFRVVAAEYMRELRKSERAGIKRKYREGFKSP